ncbi:MAG: hypothetical protein ACOX3U_07585 [Christensenellales bacterium]|jgi:hypothetical protein
MRIFEKILLTHWKIVNRMDSKRLESIKAPEGVEVISDIPYIDGARQTKLSGCVLSRGYYKSVAGNC